MKPAASKSYQGESAVSPAVKNLAEHCLVMLNECKKPNADPVAIAAKLRTYDPAEVVSESMIIPPATAASEFVGDLQNRVDRHGEPPGILTGLDDFDALTGGLVPGELGIIGARPSIGKSALGVTITNHACLTSGVPTLFVTCEMGIPALCRRLFAVRYQIKMNNLKQGTLTKEEHKHLPSFKKELEKDLYWINGVSGLSLKTLTQEAKIAVESHGVRLVIVDYLQKLKAPEKAEKRTYEVAQVSGELKAIALRHNVAVLALAQLSREAAKEKGRSPRLTDLADSGQIERDGDMIGLLDRNRSEADPDGTDATLLVAKNRDGEVGKVRLCFRGEYCRFENAI